MSNTNGTQTMPGSHAQRWLLAHDIRDPRRLQRVWRFMRGEGLRMQYSVYVLEGSRQQLDRVLQQLRGLLDERVDDVRVYAIGQSTRIWGLGRQFEDGGNLLCDAWLDRMKGQTAPVFEDPVDDREIQPAGTGN